MSLSLSVTWPKGGFKRKMGAALTAARIAAKGGVKVTTEGLKNAVRAQINAAGFKKREGKSTQSLEKTVRSAVYPKGAKASLNAAGTVFFKAPHIIQGFAEGATIRPRNGSRMLAIPTPECPRGPRNRALKPEEAIARYGKPSIFKTPAGRTAMAFELIRALSRKRPGERRATAGRRAQGRKVRLVICYWLVPMVRLPRKLDLGAALAAAGAQLNANIAAAWPRDVEEL